jgi:hypothetical protein
MIRVRVLSRALTVKTAWTRKGTDSIVDAPTTPSTKHVVAVSTVSAVDVSIAYTVAVSMVSIVDVPITHA